MSKSTNDRISWAVKSLEDLTGLEIDTTYRRNDIKIEVVVRETGLIVGETNIRISDNPLDDCLFGHCLGLFTLKNVSEELNKIRDDYNTKFGSRA